MLVSPDGGGGSAASPAPSNGGLASLAGALKSIGGALLQGLQRAVAAEAAHARSVSFNTPADPNWKGMNFSVVFQAIKQREASGQQLSDLDKGIIAKFLDEEGVVQPDAIGQAVIDTIVTAGVGGIAKGVAVGVRSLAARFAASGTSIESEEIVSETAIQKAMRLGREGEQEARDAGVRGYKERIPSFSGTAAYRVIDFADHEGETTLFTEVKNVKSIGLTSQLRDFIDYAAFTQSRFQLVVRAGTEVEPELADYISQFEGFGVRRLLADR